MEINKHIGEGFGKGELHDVLVWLAQSGIGIQGEVYYVENNAGSDGNDGSCWDKAFKTLAHAITVSNANIAAGPSGWASRNTIFCKGDAITENLTTGATKCDIIGVGSCDAQPMARLTGTHAFTGGSTLMGMRFFNLEFWNDSADSNFTFTTCDGIEFHNCKFTAYAGSTYGVSWVGATGSDIVIENCIFRPTNTGTRFATAAILLDQTTCNGFVCRNNIIEGAVGIDIDSTTLRQGYIDNNIIVATTYVIDDASQTVIVTNNQMITDETTDVTPQEVCSVNIKLAANNTVSGATKSCEMPLKATS